MHERFRFRNRNELLLKAKELNLDLPYSEDFAPLAEPANVHGFSVTNRMLVIQLTYSGRYSRPEGKAAPRAEAFLVNDHCLTHYIYLDAIKTYLENGGRSRGSYLVTEDESRQLANIADKSWKPDLCRYDRDIEKDILEIGFRDGRIIKKLVKVRDIPVQDLWFEKVWKDHPEDNFTEC